MKDRFAKAFLGVAAALLFAVAPARATTSLTMDGAWWQGLSQGEKIVALQGILDGLDSGYDSGRTNGWFEAIHTFGVPFSQVQTASSKFINDPPPNKPQFSKTFRIYIDEINLWYEVHPKRTTVKPSGLLGYCFVDKPSFSPGATCDDFGKALDK